MKAEERPTRILDHEKIWGKGKPPRASVKAQRKKKKLVSLRNEKISRGVWSMRNSEERTRL